MLTKEDILDLSPVQYNNYFSLEDELFIGELYYALIAYNKAKTDR